MSQSHASLKGSPSSIEAAATCIGNCTNAGAYSKILDAAGRGGKAQAVTRLNDNTEKLSVGVHSVQQMSTLAKSKLSTYGSEVARIKKEAEAEQAKLGGIADKQAEAANITAMIDRHRSSDGQAAIAFSEGGKTYSSSNLQSQIGTLNTEAEEIKASVDARMKELDEERTTLDIEMASWLETKASYLGSKESAMPAAPVIYNAEGQPVPPVMPPPTAPPTVEGIGSGGGTPSALNVGADTGNPVTRSGNTSTKQPDSVDIDERDREERIKMEEERRRLEEEFRQREREREERIREEEERRQKEIDDWRRNREREKEFTREQNQKDLNDTVKVLDAINEVLDNGIDPDTGFKTEFILTFDAERGTVVIYKGPVDSETGAPSTEVTRIELMMNGESSLADLKEALIKAREKYDLSDDNTALIFVHDSGGSIGIFGEPEEPVIYAPHAVYEGTAFAAGVQASTGAEIHATGMGERGEENVRSAQELGLKVHTA